MDLESTRVALEKLLGQVVIGLRKEETLQHGDVWLASTAEATHMFRQDLEHLGSLLIPNRAVTGHEDVV